MNLIIVQYHDNDCFSFLSMVVLTPLWLWFCCCWWCFFHCSIVDVELTIYIFSPAIDIAALLYSVSYLISSGYMLLMLQWWNFG